MANQNYILIERIELNASASSVTFSNIPQTGYTDLKIVISARNDQSGIQAVNIAFNGVTTNQSYRSIFGDGSGVASYSGTNPQIQYVPGTGQTANTFNNAEMYIPNYAGSTNKSFSIDQVEETNATTAYIVPMAGLWASTAAITSITFTLATGSFVANSTFSLYGIAAVGTTPVTAPKADGGNVIATDGTYWYHAFLSNGTFTPQVGLSADVLVVAGGGGSYTSPGGGGSGGGGAGGLVAFTSQPLSTTGYLCTVGAGGSDANGVNSQFGALTAAVGGGRGGAADTIGFSGGSGGGTGFRTPSSGTAAGTSGQGNAGGNTSGSYPNFNSGGGGGAGAAGGTGGTNGGAGGAGLNTYSAWATATGTGVSGYYAGGGGGMVWYTSGSAGAGGAGGGGTGASSSTGSGSNGVANTGGGAGGSAQTATAGGSGIVIVRYLVA